MENLAVDTFFLELKSSFKYNKNDEDLFVFLSPGLYMVQSMFNLHKKPSRTRL